jgi:hypothetical protein
MNPLGDMGLVGWGGAALRRRLWWRRRVFGARHAIAQAVRWVLGGGMVRRGGHDLPG